MTFHIHVMNHLLMLPPFFWGLFDTTGMTSLFQVSLPAPSKGHPSIGLQRGSRLSDDLGG